MKEDGKSEADIAHLFGWATQADAYGNEDKRSITVRRYLARAKKIIGIGTDAQCGWGEGQVIMNGQPTQVQLFCLKLDYLHKPFVMAFPRQRQEAFLEGHQKAFSWFGGVPRRISYDDLTPAAKKVLEGRNREEQVAFVAFRSYYLFDSHFATPGQAREQGRVESLVDHACRNLLVPIPRVSSFEELNRMLLERLGQEDLRRVPAEALTIGEPWEKKRSRLLPLPQYPYPLRRLRQEDLL